MSISVKFLLLEIFFLLILPSPSTAEQAEKSFPVKVVAVIDGDSIVVVDGKMRLEVRLYGIDSPEFDQPYAAQSKTFVKSRLLGKSVWIEPLDIDKYGRTVAIVVYRNSTINGDLVERGLAWVYPKYCHKKICSKWKRQENKARGKKTGLWKMNDPISPWQWKKKKYQ